MGQAQDLQHAAMRVLSFICLAALLAAQEPSPDVPTLEPRLSALKTPLNPILHRQVELAIQTRDYLKAEQILVREIDRNPRSAQLLTLAASVFFLDAKYLNTAIALKKAEKIAPLDDQSRFTLAMAYVVMKHWDWAWPELENLSRKNPANPVYLYWLGRLDYDAHRFEDALAKFKKVVAAAPAFMKAYDNLGLCYEALGEMDDAIESYERAVELNRTAAAPSPWPPLNLGTLLLKLDRRDEAKTALAESLRIDSKFARAHYQLGVLLEQYGRNTDAIRELEQAAAIDETYAQPHYALGRIYQKMGNAAKAESEYSSFERLKHETPENRAR